MRRLILLTFLFPLTATAAPWNIRPWDKPLTRTEAVETITGRTFLFGDGGRAEFNEDGRYAYIYTNGDRYDGDYVFAEDGAVCVTFDNGWDRCDIYVRQGERFILINEDGGRYPVE